MPIEPLQFDHYEVPLRADGTLWELGRGTMGITYKAFDTRLRVDVVLKVIKQDLLSSERARFLFLREARAAALVRHPNIAAVITLHDADPVYYAMEYVAGRSLSELLKARGALPPIEAIDYTDQVAAALGAMDREHIVHRDLKPANIMVVPDDERPHGNLLKVIDFGLAKGFRADDVDPETHLRSLTSWPSGFSGTVAYASPEQCAESPEIDGRSDLYSVGVILWQMLSGHLPFTGTLGQISSMHQTKEPPWEQLAATPESVLGLLRRMLAKEPEDRFPSARELRMAIAELYPQLVAGPGIRVYPNAGIANGDGTTMDVDPATLPVPATVPLGTAVPATVGLGTAVAERFTMGEPVAEGDEGTLFKAVDNQTGALVAMKLLNPQRGTDDDFCARLRDELERVSREPQGVILAPLSRLSASGDSTFYLREWANGFSLEDLLRARGGELRAHEVWRLLQELPAALDHAAAINLTLAEPLLRKLFVVPPPGAEPDDDWPALRSKPIAQWPAFRLRWNTVCVRVEDHQAAGEATRIKEQNLSATEDRVRALALLVRELLGGRLGTLTPVPALGDEANAIVQRALGRGGGTAAFGSAGAFWEALAKLPVTPVSPGAPTEPGHAAGSAAPERAREPELAVRPSIRSSIPRWIIVGVVALVVAGVSAMWLVNRGKNARKQQEEARQVAAAREKADPESEAREREERGRGVRAVPSPPAVPGASAIQTATLAQPFVNGLGMKFVPVSGVNGLFSIWETRVADYQAFCEGKPYTQNAQWKTPGYSQSPSHPVVNVSWNDAKQFCEWLTFTERKAGRIAASETYRLPTDAEWSAAVGSGKYPWGDKWPPPKETGNYFESLGLEDGYPNTAPVGSFSANASGLYDLGGNVWEWCEDEYKGSDMTDKEVTKSSDGTTFRVLRGASWLRYDPVDLRSAYRNREHPAARDDSNGFRVVVVSGSR